MGRVLSKSGFWKSAVSWVDCSLSMIPLINAGVDVVHFLRKDFLKQMEGTVLLLCRTEIFAGPYGSSKAVQCAGVGTWRGNTVQTSPGRMSQQRSGAWSPGST